MRLKALMLLAVILVAFTLENFYVTPYMERHRLFLDLGWRVLNGGLGTVWSVALYYLLVTLRPRKSPTS